MFVSNMHVLVAAYLMGLTAAAPMGPVNMLAIRRGMIGGWRHTLACGIGSVAGDLILFPLTLLGGRYLLSDLSNPTLQTVLAAIGVIILLPLGLYFLVRAVKEPFRAYTGARKRWDEGTVPAHLATDVAAGTALTIFNPATNGLLPLAFTAHISRPSFSTDGVAVQTRKRLPSVSYV